MQRRHTFARALAALPLLSLALCAGEARAQAKTLQEQLVGAWSYVSVDSIRPDGSRVPLFGPNPQGLAIFDAHGHYMLLTARAGQPRFASDNRLQGTAEEYRAVAQGSISHFGRYTVDETGKTLTFHIETSTFPNWNGVDQKRPFALSGDQLKWTTLVASDGGSAEVVLKRAP